MLGFSSAAYYIAGMSLFFLILAVLCMIAVVGSLAGGLISMAKGGEFNAKYGNKLMRLRVAFQGLALLFFAIALMSAR